MKVVRDHLDIETTPRRKNVENVLTFVKIYPLVIQPKFGKSSFPMVKLTINISGNVQYV